MKYKSLVLASLIILSLFAVVAAKKPSTKTYSTIDFTGDFTDSLPGKYRTGFFVWGPRNRAPEVTVTVVKKIINDEYTIGADEYWANGWIEIGKMKVGEKKEYHNDFIMQLTSGDDPTGMWDYEIGDRHIDDPQFYVERISRNEYRITCNDCTLKTKLYDYKDEVCNDGICTPRLIETDILWNFVATITI